MASRKRRKIAVPKEIVFLGWVLDAIVESGETVIKVKDEWHGWFMATSSGSEKLRPGRARLFLLNSDVFFSKDRKPSKKAAKTLKNWTARNPDEVFQTKAPDDFPHKQGELSRLGYSSDKWEHKGKFFDYDHDFRESGGRPPTVRTDHKDIAKSKGAVISGGTMRITNRGIA